MSIKINLIGGPLDGAKHELKRGWPVPSMIGLPHGSRVHWYEVSNASMSIIKANFVRSERKEDPK